LLITDGSGRGLKRAGARQRPCKDAQREFHPDTHEVNAQHRGEHAADHGDESEEIGLDPGGARQAAEEIHAVLDADPVEEEDEPQSADETRRR